DQVSAEFFRVMRAPIEAGRGFTPDEDRPGGAKVVVLSHGLWTRRFGGAADALGKSISLSGDAYTIVGVAAPSFDESEILPNPDAWVPFQLDPASTDQGHYFNAIGRLRAGVTLEQAQSRVAASAAEYRRRFPTALEADTGFTVDRIGDILVKDVKKTL